MKIVSFLARQKFRFDLGSSFMSIINFSLIVIAAGDKISSVLHLQTKALLLILVPTVLLSVWLFGFLLDKSKFWNKYQEEQNKRNEMLREALNK